MEMHLIDTLRELIAVTAGGLIGYAFGLLQDVAIRQNEEREQTGKLKSGWSLMPGSGMRVAYLLVTLALIQFLCPILFVDGTQWWVSGGLVLSYGFLLYRRLRRRVREAQA